ncbi:hypothetical protein B0H34DRAFT_724243 [Crassisporium funariophilum]|nr:hypothetical protein B0H34DRAFT_724243 [Crassisporium funariophilum]
MNPPTPTSTVFPMAKYDASAISWNGDLDTVSRLATDLLCEIKNALHPIGARGYLHEIVEIALDISKSSSVRRKPHKYRGLANNASRLAIAVCMSYSSAENKEEWGSSEIPEDSLKLLVSVKHCLIAKSGVFRRFRAFTVKRRPGDSRLRMEIDSIRQELDVAINWFEVRYSAHHP